MSPLISFSTALIVITATVSFTGCGDSSAGQAVSPTINPDAQSTSTASASVGIATDAGILQLYGGNNSSLAWLPSRKSTDPIWCGDETGATALAVALNTTPDSPGAGHNVITTTTYKHPSYTSGSIDWMADQIGLPANSGSIAAGNLNTWFHVTMLFDTFTVSDEKGSTATIKTGQLDLYVHDQLTSNDSLGNWSRSIDTWSVVTTIKPLTITTTPANGNARDVTVSGGRHVLRQIVRSLNNTQVTSTHIHTVDGDFSNYPVGATVPKPTTPSLTDANNTTHPFTAWQQTATLAGAAHTWNWNRFAQFALQFTHVQGALAGTAIVLDPSTQATVNNGLLNPALSIPTAIDNVYITTDGTKVGPLTWAQLRNLGIAPDWNKAAPNL